MKDAVEYIKDATTSSYEDDSVPVFTQKINNRHVLYNDRLIYHGSQYDSIDATALARNTHVNRLRENILDKVPGLCAEKQERAVTLTSFVKSSKSSLTKMKYLMEMYHRRNSHSLFQKY